MSEHFKTKGSQMKVLFADWYMEPFCCRLTELLSEIECVTAKDENHAIGLLNPPPDLIITQPSMFEGGLKMGIEALDPPPQILLWGHSRQRDLVSDYPFIELPVNICLLLSVIYKKLSEKGTPLKRNLWPE
jgi:hypothetical protein